MKTILKLKPLLKKNILASIVLIDEDGNIIEQNSNKLPKDLCDVLLSTEKELNTFITDKQLTVHSNDEVYYLTDENGNTIETFDSSLIKEIISNLLTQDLSILDIYSKEKANIYIDFVKNNHLNQSNIFLDRDDVIKFSFGEGYIYIDKENKLFLPNAFVNKIHKEKPKSIEKYVTFLKLLWTNKLANKIGSIFRYLDKLSDDSFEITNSGYLLGFKAVYSRKNIHNIKDEFALLDKHLYENCLSENKDYLTKYTLTKKGIVPYNNTIHDFTLKDLVEEKYGNDWDRNQEMYTDMHSKTTTIILNKPCRLHISECDTNNAIECSSGLHVGTFRYVQTFGNSASTYLLVMFSPKDIISVPEHDSSKIRVSSYIPLDAANNLEEIKEKMHQMANVNQVITYYDEKHKEESQLELETFVDAEEENKATIATRSVNKNIIPQQKENQTVLEFSNEPIITVFTSAADAKSTIINDKRVIKYLCKKIGSLENLKNLKNHKVYTYAKCFSVSPNVTPYFISDKDNPVNAIPVGYEPTRNSNPSTFYHLSASELFE